jgi:hypothetical protein
MDDRKVHLVENIITQRLLNGDFSRFFNDLKMTGISATEAKDLDPFGDVEIGKLVASVIENIDNQKAAQDSITELYKYAKQAEKLFSHIGLGEYNMSDKDFVKVDLDGKAEEAYGLQGDYVSKVDPTGQNPDISKSISELIRKVDMNTDKLNKVFSDSDIVEPTEDVVGAGDGATDIYGNSDEVIEEGVVTPEPVGNFSEEANFGVPIYSGIKRGLGTLGVVEDLKDRAAGRRGAIAYKKEDWKDKAVGDIFKRANKMGVSDQEAGKLASAMYKGLGKDLMNDPISAKNEYKSLKKQIKSDRIKSEILKGRVNTAVDIGNIVLALAPKVAAATGEITRELKGSAGISSAEARDMLEDIVSNKALTETDALRAIDQYAAKAKSQGANITPSMINEAKAKLKKNFSFATDFAAEDLSVGSVINAYRDDNFSELLIVGKSFSEDYENNVVKAIVLSSEGYDKAGSMLTFSVPRDAVFSVSDTFDFNTGVFFSENYGDSMKGIYFSDDEDEITEPTDEVTQLPDEIVLENAAGDPIDSGDTDAEADFSEGDKVLVIVNEDTGNVTKEGPFGADDATRKAETLRQKGLKVTLVDPSEAGDLVAKKKMSLKKKILIGAGVAAAAGLGTAAYLNRDKISKGIKSLGSKKSDGYDKDLKDYKKVASSTMKEANTILGTRADNKQVENIKHMDNSDKQKFDTLVKNVERLRAGNIDERKEAVNKLVAFLRIGDNKTKFGSFEKIFGKTAREVAYSEVDFSEDDSWFILGKVTKDGDDPILVKEGPFTTKDEADTKMDELMKKYDGMKREFEVTDDPESLTVEKEAADLEVGDVTTIGTEGGVASEVVIKDKETTEDGDEIVTAEVLSSEKYPMGSILTFSVDEYALFSVHDVYSSENGVCFSEMAFSGDKVYFLTAEKDDKLKKFGPLDSEKADAKAEILRSEGFKVTKYADEDAAVKAINKRKLALGLAIGGAALAGLGTAAYLNRGKISKGIKSNISEKETAKKQGVLSDKVYAKKTVLELTKAKKERDNLLGKLDNLNSNTNNDIANRKAKDVIQKGLSEINKIIRGLEKDARSAVSSAYANEQKRINNYSEVDAIDLEVGDITTITNDGEDAQIVVTDVDSVGDEQIVKGTVLADGENFSAGDEICFRVDNDYQFSLDDHYDSDSDLLFSEAFACFDDECEKGDEECEDKGEVKEALELEEGDVTTISDDDGDPIKLVIKEATPEDDGSVKIEGTVIDTEHSQFSVGDEISFSVDMDAFFSIEDTLFNIDVNPSTEPVVTVVERTVTAPADSAAAAQAVGGDQPAAEVAPDAQADVGPGDPNLKDGETVMASYVSDAEKKLFESSNFSEKSGELSLEDKLRYLNS